jgi:ferric-dicitrate binding protein FerR (iron transport regulator)
MEKPDQYLKYAEDCERMAASIPTHAEALRSIAEAWRKLAKEAEQKERRSKEIGLESSESQRLRAIPTE